MPEIEAKEMSADERAEIERHADSDNPLHFTSAAAQHRYRLRGHIAFLEAKLAEARAKTLEEVAEFLRLMGNSEKWRSADRDGEVGHFVGHAVEYIENDWMKDWLTRHPAIDAARSKP